MIWRFVESSSLHYIGYDRKKKMLHVWFRASHWYTYDNVSYYRYRKLLHAESKGRYFNRFIRLKYVYHKIE
jgi:hypothetical protein